MANLAGPILRPILGPMRWSPMNRLIPLLMLLAATCATADPALLRSTLFPLASASKTFRLVIL